MDTQVRLKTPAASTTERKPAVSKLNRGIYSSASAEWETPLELFDALNEIFHFTLDVCATPLNAKCARYYTKADDGLSSVWHGVCWMNPPYGREIGMWVKKAYESTIGARAVVVCLLPARTDTRWWHDYVIKHAFKILFLPGRLKFSKNGVAPKSRAPFPSALVIFGQSKQCLKCFIADHSVPGEQSS
jgi:phage N-6-adenine-methyltransferase